MLTISTRRPQPRRCHTFGIPPRPAGGPAGGSSRIGLKYGTKGLGGIYGNRAVFRGPRARVRAERGYFRCWRQGPKLTSPAGPALRHAPRAFPRAWDRQSQEAQRFRILKPLPLGGEACAERGASPEGPQLRGTVRPERWAASGPLGKGLSSAERLGAGEARRSCMVPSLHVPRIAGGCSPRC